MARNGGGDRTSLDLYLGTSIVPWSDAGRDRSASSSGHDPDAIQAPRVPAEVGRRYQIRDPLGDKLGAGGFGAVYRATDRVTGEQVAVKLLDPGRGAAPVRREAVALRGLRLPGVVRLLDEGREEDRPFLVMELVEGQPFPGLATPAPWAAIEDATLRLLEVLGRVHAAGVLHLDIKPANVRVTPRARWCCSTWGWPTARPWAAPRAAWAAPSATWRPSCVTARQTGAAISTRWA